MNIRRIQELEAKPDFMLAVVFDNGVKKVVDCKPYLNFPVFQVLKNGLNFNNVRNCGYYIEWAPFEIDLSADTLWADGRQV